MSVITSNAATDYRIKCRHLRGVFLPLSLCSLQVDSGLSRLRLSNPAGFSGGAFRRLRRYSPIGVCRRFRGYRASADVRNLPLSGRLRRRFFQASRLLASRAEKIAWARPGNWTFLTSCRRRRVHPCRAHKGGSSRPWGPMRASQRSVAGQHLTGDHSSCSFFRVGVSRGCRLLCLGIGHGQPKAVLPFRRGVGCSAPPPPGAGCGGGSFCHRPQRYMPWR